MKNVFFGIYIYNFRGFWASAMYYDSMPIDLTNGVCNNNNTSKMKIIMFDSSANSFTTMIDMFDSCVFTSSICMPW